MAVERSTLPLEVVLGCATYGCGGGSTYLEGGSGGPSVSLDTVSVNIPSSELLWREWHDPSFWLFVWQEHTLVTF